MSNIQQRYFQWMMDQIRNPDHPSIAYRKLLSFLNDVDFTYSLEMDGNRYGDGEDLRYRFGVDARIPSNIIANELDICPVSVLEMMVALAKRCEEHIMGGDPDREDRTGEWFWRMIDNLGLLGAFDSEFDVRSCEDIIRRFLERDYDPDGLGGLFYIPGIREDMRRVEILYQLYWYLEFLDID